MTDKNPTCLHRSVAVGEKDTATCLACGAILVPTVVHPAWRKR